jgi:hypothetical protein
MISVIVASSHRRSHRRHYHDLGEAVGSVLLLSGVTAGLYLATSSMTLLTVYSISGAWLLVLGARDAG